MKKAADVTQPLERQSAELLSQESLSLWWRRASLLTAAISPLFYLANNQYLAYLLH